MEKDARQSRLRVLLADEECVRTPLLHLLSNCSQLEIVGDTSPEQTTALLRGQPPDVLLSGTYPPQRALSLLAELGSMRIFDRPLAIAHLAQDRSGAWECWRARGFDGYLLKESPSATLAGRLLRVVAKIREGQRTATR